MLVTWSKWLLCVNLLVVACRVPKKLESPDILCLLSSPVAEATYGGLKYFVGVTVKVSGLESPGSWLSTTMKEVSCPLGCCCPLVATWLC